MVEETDQRFAARVQSAISTAQAWDEDESLLSDCRSSIPFPVLRNDEGPYSEPSDRCLSRDARFVQRLARYFKNTMTWVNNPPCSVCHSTDKTSHKLGRGPETDEEKEGKASRVEVYVCSNQTCAEANTAFPRYNSARKLLQTKRGRCGEYANLFGLYCRSVGLETRYVSDWTDHVWTEVFLQESDSWIMVDSCEGVISEPSMYEAGWGKKLNFIIGATVDHVIDLTPRYTRQFLTDDFQARRRAVTSSEQVSREILSRANMTLQSGLAPKVRSELERRLAREEKQLAVCRNTMEWEREYGRGRVSGSLTWKIARQEAGKNHADENDKNNKEPPPPESFHVESFFPTLTCSRVTISVHPKPKSRHDGIVVSGLPCAAGNPNTLSAVVIDEDYLGCVLQSRSFSSLPSLADFIDTLPTNRIVAVQGSLPSSEAHGNVNVERQLNQLWGFDCDLISEGVLFIGQVRASPDWAYCGSFASAPNGYKITPTNESKVKELKLSTKCKTRPSCIVGRLPEDIMPLQTQILAKHEQKRTAFLSYLKKEGYGTVSGYASTDNTPVYLLGSSAYPLERIDSNDQKEQSWNTFLLLPPPLAADDDIGIADDAAAKASSEMPKFDIPLESSFFVSHLGSELLIKENGSELCKTDTLSALHNARLIGLYYSAHWCMPCRTFTPMLAEMYEVLKEAFPTHGLEIVFVSSDRDMAQFDNYYASMPWAALPFDSPDFSSLKQMLSMKYGVQGIPSLVVLDAMSGQTVVSTAASRKEVMEACKRGEEGIEAMFQNWFGRLPAETKEMMSMLELSCADTTGAQDAASKGGEEPINPYLVRPASSSGEKSNRTAKEETAAKVKAAFEKLVKEGHKPNEAAARAIKMVASGSGDEEGEAYDKGPLDGKFTGNSLKEQSLVEDITINIDDKDRSVVASTLIKYVNNAVKAPWTPKFRHFKLSNKVADRIVRAKYGIDWMRSLGLEITATDQDFYGSLPLATDLEALQTKLTKILEEGEK